MARVTKAVDGSGPSYRVFLVYVPVQFPNNGPNRKLIAAKLSAASAQKILDREPGSYLVRVFADKTDQLNIPQTES